MFLFLPLFTAMNPALVAHAEIYMSAEEACKIFFANQIFTKKSYILNNDEKTKISELSDTQLKTNNVTYFSSPAGNAVFVDQVLGKHEQITYAVGVNKDGKIQGVEILEYRESYGGQIRKEEWRKQFAGKDKSSVLKINTDIKNISGATLSSTHVTD
ncbi:MAG: FMN-binding protein, partial [Pseudobdellovibrio sp.]